MNRKERNAQIAAAVVTVLILALAVFA